MTREEALESGIVGAIEFVWPGSDGPDGAAVSLFLLDHMSIMSPDEIEGFAVGLTMIAVEVAEIARKRREVEATSEAPESQRESTAQAPVVPKVEAFTYERVEVAGPAGDPIWTYERRREAE